MYRAISASSSAVSSRPRSSARWSRRSARACCRFRLVNSARKAEFISADSVVPASASIAATRSASRVTETFRLAGDVKLQPPATSAVVIASLIEPGVQPLTVIVP